MAVYEEKEKDVFRYNIILSDNVKSVSDEPKIKLELVEDKESSGEIQETSEDWLKVVKVEALELEAQQPTSEDVIDESIFFKCEKSQAANEEEKDIQKISQGLQSNEMMPFLGEVCPKKFFKQSNLTNHMTSHATVKNSNNNERSYRIFKSKGQMKNCLVTQRRGKPYDAKFFKKGMQDFTNSQNELNSFMIRPYSCEVCSSSFYSKSILKAHKKIHEDENYMCVWCKKTFQVERNMKAHMKTHHQGTLYSCRVCRKTFSALKDVNVHVVGHIEQNVDHKEHFVHGTLDDNKLHINVDNCNEKQRGGSEKSLIIVHLEPFNCDLCDKDYKTKSSLKAHLKSHEGGKLFVCRICREGFYSRTTMLVHRITHFTCKVCSEIFPGRKMLKAHMKGHTRKKKEKLDAKPHTCDVCLKSFREKCKLHVHMRCHTGERPFACNVCKQTFISDRYLAQHMRLHTGDTPYFCKFCNKRFLSKTFLETHIRRHTGERPYQCDGCPKAFSTRGYLKKHRRLHRGEKVSINPTLERCSCYLCDSTFSRKDNLARHLKKHMKRDAHMCDLCGRRIWSKLALKRHRRNHIGEKIRPCGLCGKIFSRKIDVQKHMRVHMKRSYLELFGKKEEHDDS